MKNFILLLILAVASQASAKAPLTVAIIDTGYTRMDGTVHLCKDGLYDLTRSGSTEDISKNKHGSNVAGIITRYAGQEGYCIMMFKVFRYKTIGKGTTFDVPAYIAALQLIEKLRPTIVNISLTGDLVMPSEEIFLKRILDNGTAVAAAAGNEGMDLNLIGCVAFPACVDPRIYVVGNSNGSSNIGRAVDVFEDGSNQRGGGVTLTGTSQATAVFTGKYIRKMLGGVK